MAAITDPVTIAILMAVAAVALILAITILFRNARQKRERALLDAFGRVPKPDTIDIESINAYHGYCSSATQHSKRIDATTWSDLNMDDVFARINVCSSSVGEEYLFHMLHDLEHDKSNLKRREHIIQWFADHPKERVAAQRILLGIGKRRSNGLSGYIFNAKAKKIGHGWIFAVMACLPVAGLILTPFVLVAGLALTAAAIAANIIVYYLKSLRLESELESMKYMASLLFGAKALRKRLGHKLHELGYDLEGAIKPFKRTGGMIPGNTRQALAELEALMVVFKAVFLVDLIRYNRTVSVMLRNQKALDGLFRIVGEMDAAISIASFRKSLKHYGPPEFHDKNAIEFQGLYHPLIAEPVTNSGEVGAGSLITGSNASGKSTFIKALAVNNILAQTIHTCCAERYRLKLSYVATSMALRDNIVGGESYFVAEIKSLKRIVACAKAQYCTCFVDEILRGTNTRERIAAGAAVLKLLRETKSLFVVASHDIELTEILNGIYDNYHFSEKIVGNAVEFDYLLKDGPSRSTNAIKLLASMGFDRQIVDEATALLDHH